MVQVIRQPSTSVITKEGEVKILLEITLNINTNTVESKTVVVDKSVEEKPPVEETKWAIPSFKMTEKMQIGKKVED